MAKDSVNRFLVHLANAEVNQVAGCRAVHLNKPEAARVGYVAS